MALSQQAVTVSPTAGRYGPMGAVARATWATGLGGATKLVSAVPVAPASPNGSEGIVNVRARIDSGTVTLELSGPSFDGPTEVLVTVDA